MKFKTSSYFKIKGYLRKGLFFLIQVKITKIKLLNIYLIQIILINLKLPY
jgi:hypothetical protein